MRSEAFSSITFSPRIGDSSTAELFWCLWFTERMTEHYAGGRRIYEWSRMVGGSTCVCLFLEILLVAGFLFLFLLPMLSLQHHTLLSRHSLMPFLLRLHEKDFISRKLW